MQENHILPITFARTHPADCADRHVSNAKAIQPTCSASSDGTALGDSASNSNLSFSCRDDLFYLSTPFHSKKPRSVKTGQQCDLPVFESFSFGPLASLCLDAPLLRRPHLPLGKRCTKVSPIPGSVLRARLFLDAFVHGANLRMIPHPLCRQLLI